MFPILLRHLNVRLRGRLWAGGALPAQSHASVETHRTIRAGGVERSYLLHRPSSRSAGQPVPLLLVFHGFAEVNGCTLPPTVTAEPDTVRDASRTMLDFFDRNSHL